MPVVVAFVVEGVHGFDDFAFAVAVTRQLTSVHCFFCVREDTSPHCPLSQEGLG